MSSVVISGDSSGQVSLTVPSAAGTNTATLPAATGTVMVSGNMPAFSAYMSANQSIATNTYTKVQFNTKQFDTNSNYDNVTNYRFTPTVAGYYNITANIAGPNTAIGSCATVLYKNGSATWWLSILPNASGSTQTGGSFLTFANGTTDYFEIYVYQTAGTTQNIFSGIGGSYFQASMIRSA